MQKYAIQTERLGLRLLEENDITLLEPLENDPIVKRYFPDGVRDRAKVEAMIKKFMNYYTERGIPCFLLFDRITDEFIGRAGFGVMETDEIEVGYVLHQKFWGQGYASEALGALLDYAKRHIDAEYIIACATIDNVGSLRVMEKCGMSYYKTDMAKGAECRFYRVKNKK